MSENFLIAGYALLGILGLVMLNIPIVEYFIETGDGRILIVLIIWNLFPVPVSSIWSSLAIIILLKSKFSHKQQYSASNMARNSKAN